MTSSPTKRPPLGIAPGHVLALAVWFGVLTGVGEVICQGIRKYGQGIILHQPEDMLWMALLADVAFFLISGTCLAIAVWALPRVFTLWTVVLVLATQSFFSLLYNFDGIHNLARLALAAGLAVQVARLAYRRPTQFNKLIALTTCWFRRLAWPPWRREPAAAQAQAANSSAPGELLLDRRQVLLASTATIAGVAGGLSVWRGITERLALRALPSPPADAPNVILIVMDTVRAASLSLHGYARRTTPQLEQLGERSVCFHRAMAAAPWTLPSHAAMFTGRPMHETRVDFERPLDATYPTLAEALGAAGYQTTAFFANLHFGCREFGLDRGFATYEVFGQTPGQVLLASSIGRRLGAEKRLRPVLGYREWGSRDAAAINREFLGWLGRRDVDRPFFAFLNLMDAHEPFIPAPGFELMFGSRRCEDPYLHHRHYSAAEVEVYRDAYESCIAGLDDRIGQLLRSLEARNLLNNTLLIVTSDHGEQFGEHGLTDHSNSLYLPLLHVPLLMSMPSRLPAGRSVEHLVSLRDLPATILELLDLDNRAAFPGTPMSWSWRNGHADRAASSPALLAETGRQPNWLPNWYPARKGPMKSLFKGSHHYILNGDGKEELYDFVADPLELRDLCATEAGRSMLSSFQASLRAMLPRDQTS